MNHIFGTAFFITNQKGVNVKSSNTDVYFKCICVFFASLHRFYPTERKELFVNSSLPERFSNILEQFNVVITIVPKSNQNFVSSSKLFNKFPGCLFSLDVFSFIQNNSNYKGFEKLILLDNDTVLLKKIEVENQSILGIEIDYEFNKDINGKSRAVLSYVNSVNGGQNLVKWFGGEFICLDLNQLQRFNENIDFYFKYFENNIELFGDNLTEEHIYSILLSNENNTNQDYLIKRVWTTNGYNNVVGNENRYAILHYPSEKNKLFINLFDKVEQNNLFLTNLKEIDYTAYMLAPINYFLNRNLMLYIKQFLAIIKKKCSINE